MPPRERCRGLQGGVEEQLTYLGRSLCSGRYVLEPMLGSLRVLGPVTWKWWQDYPQAKPTVLSLVHPPQEAQGQCRGWLRPVAQLSQPRSATWPAGPGAPVAALAAGGGHSRTASDR